MSFLTLYLVMLFGINSRYVVGPLGAAGSPAALLGLAGLGWWMYHQVQRPDLTRWGPQPVRRALLLLTLSFSASYVVAMARPIDGTESSTANLGMVALFGWLGVALLAHDGIQGPERLEVFTSRLVFATTALAALGIAQFVTNDYLVDRIPIPGLSLNGEIGGLFNRSGFARPPGTALHPIEFGAVLTAVLPIAITRARVRRGVGVVRRWLPVGLIGLVVALSGSRSATLCAVVALLVLGVTWSARDLLHTGLLVLVMLAFVAAAVPGMLGNLLGLFAGAGNDASIASRTGSYAIVGEFFARNPILGRGFSTFLPSYRILDNELLLLLVEVGLTGLLLFLGVLATAAFCGSRVRKNAPDPETREMGQAYVAAMAASAVGLATYDGLGFPMATGVLFLLIGLAGANWRLIRLSTPDRDDSPARSDREAASAYVDAGSDTLTRTGS